MLCVTVTMAYMKTGAVLVISSAYLKRYLDCLNFSHFYVPSEVPDVSDELLIVCVCVSNSF